MPKSTVGLSGLGWGEGCTEPSALDVGVAEPRGQSCRVRGLEHGDGGMVPDTPLISMVTPGRGNLDVLLLGMFGLKFGPDQACSAARTPTF